MRIKDVKIKENISQTINFQDYIKQRIKIEKIHMFGKIKITDYITQNIKIEDSNINV